MDIKDNIRFGQHKCYVQCSHCGARVSNIVLSSLPEGLVVRAFVECVDCVQKQPDAGAGIDKAVKAEREKILQSLKNIKPLGDEDERLFYINWGDGDNTYIMAKSKEEAKKKCEYPLMINYVVELKETTKMLYQASHQNVIDQIKEIYR